MLVKVSLTCLIVHFYYINLLKVIMVHFYMALKIFPQDLAEKQTLVFMPWRYRLK